MQQNHFKLAEEIISYFVRLWFHHSISQRIALRVIEKRKFDSRRDNSMKKSKTVKNQKIQLKSISDLFFANKLVKHTTKDHQLLSKGK